MHCLQKHLGQGHELLYLCHDETRLGLKTIQGKVLTARGIKPTVEVQWKRDNYWIYGAIAPVSGECFQQEQPQLNGACFQSFLDWLSVQLGERWAFLQIDQAGAHLSRRIQWPKNIIPIVQPSHSPELNPIERLWQWLKRPLKNRIFPTLEALKAAVQEMFEQLRPEQVRSIANYDFIWDALLYAASC